MAGRIERRFYRQIAPLEVLVNSYTVPNGEKLSIEELGVNSSISPDTIAKIIWDYGGGDETILLVAPGNIIHKPYEMVCEGNGTKVLAIVLVNDRLVSEYIGGFWLGNS